MTILLPEAAAVTVLLPESAAPTVLLPDAAPDPTKPRELRGYQVEAADAVTAAHADGVVGPAVVLPTGSGKTTVIAELTRREVVAGRRVLLMAHRNELIEQMAAAVCAVYPSGPVPSRIGGPHREDPTAQVVSATVQSLQQPATLERLGMRDLVIVDEAHHAPARTYQAVLEHFHAMGARRVGFTATMVRHDAKKDAASLRDTWNRVVFERDVLWAIENGFLIRPRGVTVEIADLDIDLLATGADGDITDDAAEEAMMREASLNAAVEAVIDHTEGLSSIVFGASVLHCERLVEMLTDQGESAEVIVGSTKVRDRAGIYQRFHNGETRILSTVDVLTEGADFPRCAAVVLARPTRSQSRLVQQVGRALRPYSYADGSIKESALVVDLVGAGTLGLVVETKLDRPEPKELEFGFGCWCAKPCAGGDACDDACPGGKCCNCECNAQPIESIDDVLAGPECTCECKDEYRGLCRCGCVCDEHRVDPLVVFDPLSGIVSSAGSKRRGDSPWSQRTATIRWVSHPRGLVRNIYRAEGSRGLLLLADMRDLPGTVPGMDWAFGFYDAVVGRMFWVRTDGQWAEPGPTCHLQGMSLAQADDFAQRLFHGHMRDPSRAEASMAQIQLATAMGVADADQLDRRDLSDMLAHAQAEKLLPEFDRPTVPEIHNLWRRRK